MDQPGEETVQVERQDEEFLFHFDKGSDLLSRGDADGARMALERALELRPRDLNVLGLLGQACYRSARYDEAITAWERLVNENPAEPAAHVNLGLSFLRGHRLVEAMRHFEIAIDLNPEHRKAMGYMGLALLEGGDPLRARDWFRRAGSEQMVARCDQLLGKAATDAQTAPDGATETPSKAPESEPVAAPSVPEAHAEPVTGPLIEPLAEASAAEGAEEATASAEPEATAEGVKLAAAPKEAEPERVAGPEPQPEPEVEPEPDGGPFVESSPYPAEESSADGGQLPEPVFEAAFEPLIGQITDPLVEAVEAPVPVPSMAPLDDSVVVPVIDPDPDLQNEPLLAAAPVEDAAEVEPVTELDLVSDDAALPLDVDVQEVEEEVAPTVAVETAPTDSPPAALEMESPSEAVEPQEELPPEELVPEEPIRLPVDDVGPQTSEMAEEEPPAPELFAPLPARLAVPELILAPDIAAYAAGRQVEVGEGATFGLADGLLVVQVRVAVRVRLRGLLAARGALRAAPEVKRFRGRPTDRHFGEGVARLHRIQGEGLLLFTPGAQKLTSLALGVEPAFFREEAVFGFEESLAFDNGRVPSSGGGELNLVHLRGRGAVLLATAQEPRALEVVPDAPLRVPVAALVGWVGALTPRLVTLLEGGVAGAIGAELIGAGTVLVDPGQAGAAEEP